MWERFEKEIFEYVKEKMKNGAHGLDHVLRVVKLARYIGELEGADMDVLMPAAYLHDIARSAENGKTDHAKIGAAMASEFLKRIGYPEDKISEIHHAIKVHRYKSEEKPRTLEALILKDADMLDAIGAVGIYRAVFHSCETGRNLEDTIRHFEEKILNIRKALKTKTAIELAERRHEIVVMFLENLKSELSFP